MDAEEARKMAVAGFDPTKPYEDCLRAVREAARLGLHETYLFVPGSDLKNCFDKLLELRYRVSIINVSSERSKLVIRW